MFCPKCGTKNSTSSNFCLKCGALLSSASEEHSQQPSVSSQQVPHIPNRMVGAILVTIFCCLPAGIVAIVYASQVNTKIAAHDYAGAQSSSNSAQTWITVSVVLGIIAGFIAFVSAFMGSF